jgi:hypothetical protein
VIIKLTPVNDEVPVFKNLPRPFLATVPPNAGPGTFVYQLMADDADVGSEVRYILESGKVPYFTSTCDENMHFHDEHPIPFYDMLGA